MDLVMFGWYLRVARKVLDSIHDTVHHDSHIFPSNTNLTCTLTALNTANTFSNWAEIADSASTTLASLFTQSKGHITECSIESLSEENTIYEVEIAAGGTSKDHKITSIRFAGSGKFQTPSAVQRLWAPPLPQGGRIYYRMRTATSAVDTAIVNFRYHLEIEIHED